MFTGNKDEHIVTLKSMGFNESQIDIFDRQWEQLYLDGYEMYALYSVKDTNLKEISGCVICSKKTGDLKWEKVITPSMDCAVIFTVCSDCDSQYVTAALKQKALGRLLKERTTR